MGAGIQVVILADFEAYQDRMEKRLRTIEAELQLYKTFVPTLEWITKQQAMEVLDCRETKIWGLVRQGKIQTSSVGGSVRYKMSSISAYLNERGVDNEEVIKKLQKSFKNSL